MILIFEPRKNLKSFGLVIGWLLDEKWSQIHSEKWLMDGNQRSNSSNKYQSQAKKKNTQANLNNHQSEWIIYTYSISDDPYFR